MHPALTSARLRHNPPRDDMLPAMRSDTVLGHGVAILVVDTMRYSRTTQRQFDKRSIHSGNLFLIFTCAKITVAKLSGVPHEVSDILPERMVEHCEAMRPLPRKTEAHLTQT